MHSLNNITWTGTKFIQKWPKKAAQFFKPSTQMTSLLRIRSFLDPLLPARQFIATAGDICSYRGGSDFRIFDVIKKYVRNGWVPVEQFLLLRFYTSYSTHSLCGLVPERVRIYLRGILTSFGLLSCTLGEFVELFMTRDAGRSLRSR